MKIMIADDNAFYRTILKSAVAKLGHEVIIAIDGKMAWQMFQDKDPPQIAILDWIMPGMTGLEVCEKVRSLHPENPPYIIILTVKDTREDLLSALQCGSDDYLTKPFDQEELCARLQVGIRITTLQNQLAQRVDTLEAALSQTQKLESIGR